MNISSIIFYKYFPNRSYLIQKEKNNVFVLFLVWFPFLFFYCAQLQNLNQSINLTKRNEKMRDKERINTTRSYSRKWWWTRWLFIMLSFSTYIDGKKRTSLSIKQATKYIWNETIYIHNRLTWDYSVPWCNTNKLNTENFSNQTIYVFLFWIRNPAKRINFKELNNSILLLLLVLSKLNEGAMSCGTVWKK